MEKILPPLKKKISRGVVIKRSVLQKRMVYGFLGTLFIFLTINFFIFVSINKLVESANIERHTVEVLKHLEHMLSSLSDAETGQRGYLLTGELKYLEPYNSGISTVYEELEEVKKLTQDNLNQQNRLVGLEDLIEAKKSELQETVDLVATGKLDEAITIVLSDRGKDIMDNIRDVIHSMENEENDLLALRQADFRDSQELTKMILGFGSIIGTFFILFVSLFIMRTNDKK